MNNNFSEAKKMMMEKMDRAMKKVCALVESQAKANSPVKTGELRRRITHAVETDENESRGRVGGNLEYMPHVELGTSKTKAQPYLRPAIEENIDKIKDIIHQELEVK